MNVAVIFAGGVGSRMSNATLPKQFLEIHGKPIIAHTIDHFQEHPEIDGVAVAILPQWRERLERIVQLYGLTKVRWIVDGGGTGQESRHRALSALAPDVPADSIVLVHDGVRPLIDADLISRNIATARERGSAITCSKVTETIVVSETDEIGDVIPRDHLYAAQAPQTFRLGTILSLYDRAVAEGITDSIDSCSLMQQYGEPIYRVIGPRSNIKITTAEDFYVCRTYFELIENRQVGAL